MTFAQLMHQLKTCSVVKAGYGFQFIQRAKQ